MSLLLLWPAERKLALKQIDGGSTIAFAQLYNFFAAQTHAGESSEFDQEELKVQRKLLADRASVAFLCPSAFPTFEESGKLYSVANCILSTIVQPEAEYLNAFLNLLERKEIVASARLAMASCLKKFLPNYHDTFTLDSLEKRIVSAMVGESGDIFRELDETFCAVRERFARTHV